MSGGEIFRVKETEAAYRFAGCNLGGTTDFFVPYRDGEVLIFLRRKAESRNL